MLLGADAALERFSRVAGAHETNQIDPRSHVDGLIDSLPGQTKGILPMFGCLARLLLALASLVMLHRSHSAHDSWISRGGHRNAAGEWCCGEGDCAMMDPKSVTLTSSGYALSGWGTIEGNGHREFYDERVPEPEAQPSPDGGLALQAAGWHPALFLAPPPAT